MSVDRATKTLRNCIISLAIVDRFLRVGSTSSTFFYVERPTERWKRKTQTTPMINLIATTMFDIKYLHPKRDAVVSAPLCTFSNLFAHIWTKLQSGQHWQQNNNNNNSRDMHMTMNDSVTDNYNGRQCQWQWKPKQQTVTTAAMIALKTRQ